MKKCFKVMLVVLALSTVLSACGKSDDINNETKDEKFTIVTSFYPMYVSTINVAKDIEDVEVINMTEPQSGCLHDYQLCPADLKTLEKADAFIINGAGMEAFMDKVIKQIPDLNVVEASKDIELIKNKTDGEENSHVWVSISNAMLQVENIGEQLSELNPENAEKYQNNVDEYVEKLKNQKGKMHEKLDDLKNRDIITFHEAFPYFAKEFNLNVVAVVEREPGAEPSAGDLANTIKLIEEKGVKALFAEPQYSPKAAESIAKQTGAKVYSLDPMVTGSNDADLDDYLNKMDENLNSLLEALQDE